MPPDSVLCGAGWRAGEGRDPWLDAPTSPVDEVQRTVRCAIRVTGRIREAGKVRRSHRKGGEEIRGRVPRRSRRGSGRRGVSTARQRTPGSRPSSSRHAETCLSMSGRSGSGHVFKLGAALSIGALFRAVPIEAESITKAWRLLVVLLASIARSALPSLLTSP